MLDHLLEPDLPSKKELWVEQQVEERTEALSDLLAYTEDLPEWIDEVINWGLVEEKLRKDLEQQWDEEQAEAEISAWEARQEAQGASCRDW